MDIQLEKSLLIKRFEQINDIEFIKLLNKLLDFALMRQEEKKADLDDEIPEFHKRILDERLADCKENPDDVVSWEEVKEQVNARL